MPETWGLYFLPPAGPFHKNHKSIAVLPYTGRHGFVVAASIDLASIPFKTVLGNPDIPAAWGARRPAALAFRQGETTKTLQFEWNGTHSPTTLYIDRIGDGLPAR